MRIISKREAMRVKNDCPGSVIMRFSSGKFKWTGKSSDYIGQEMTDVTQQAIAVYVERRADQHGPYAQLMCVFVPCF